MIDYLRAVFVVHPKHPTGVDYWRAINPVRAMQRYEFCAECAPQGQNVPMWYGAEPNVLVYNQRASGAEGSAYLGRQSFFEPHKCLMVADCCDDPEPTDSVLARSDHHSEKVLDLIRACHLVTVQTKAMARVVRKYNKHVEIIPDLIEPRQWVWNTPKERPRNPTVGVAGGDTHTKDWKVLADAWPEVAKKHENAHFVAVGTCPDYLKGCGLGDRLHVVPWEMIDTYPRSYKWIDVGCAPLLDTKWNGSKSPIKWQEYTLAGAVTIASPTVYGSVVRHGRNGLIATTVDEWINLIGCCLTGISERSRLVANARNDVLSRFSLDEKSCTARARVYQDHYKRVYGQEITARPRTIDVRSFAQPFPESRHER